MRVVSFVMRLASEDKQVARWVRRVVARQVSDPVSFFEGLGLAEGKGFRTRKPVSFRVSSDPPEKKQPRFLPQGSYLTLNPEGSKMHFRRPLVIDWGGLGKDNWQRRLFDFMGGTLKGKRLSHTLLKDFRFDGLIILRRGMPFGAFDLLPSLSKKERQEVEAERRQALGLISRKEASSQAAQQFEEMYAEQLENVEVTPYYDSRGERSRIIKDLFGTTRVTDEQVAALAGIAGWPGENEIEIEYLDDAITIEGKGEYIEYMKREIRRDEDGRLMIYNEHIKKVDGAPEGIGVAAFHSQILMARALGVDKLHCYAQRDDKLGYGGYYIWPRFGYNVPLLGAALKDGSVISEQVLVDLVGQGILDPDIVAPSFHDLMRTPAGRTFWKTQGDSLYLDFELLPNAEDQESKGVQVFQKYMEERARLSAGKKAAVRMEEGDDIALTPDEDRLLDLVWDHMNDLWG